MFVNEDILLDLLNEKEEYKKLKYYIIRVQINECLNNIIEQINKKISQIATISST